MSITKTTTGRIAAVILIFWYSAAAMAQGAYSSMPDVMPGSRSLAAHKDRTLKMLDGAHRFVETKIEEAARKRADLWKRDFTSRENYERSVDPNRKRLMKLLGIVDHERTNNYAFPQKDRRVFMEKFSEHGDPALVAETALYSIYQVRWPVLDGVFGEGLLIEPKGVVAGNIVAVPDADQTPEQLAGLAPGIAPSSQFVRHLGQQGFRVIVPVLVSRALLFPGQEHQQTYREWLYRQAFHMGRHLIGYEVQKVIAAAEWILQSNDNNRVGVAGYGEGGMIAFFAAAIDKRIDAALVSGYFAPREKVWDEPLYRNVWNQLSEFGDAETAALIAPRPLVIEYSHCPDVEDRIFSDAAGRMVEGWPFTGYKGKVRTPPADQVAAEFERIRHLIDMRIQSASLVAGPGGQPVNFGSEDALRKFCASLGHTWRVVNDAAMPQDTRKSFDISERQIRQVRGIEEHVQDLLRDSDQSRKDFFLYSIMPEFAERRWSTSPYHQYFPLSRFTEGSRPFRAMLRNEILGSFDDKYLAPDARTRKLYDRPRWTGYEVELDVYKDLIAAGILLIPKDLKEGERRPVVVCQHGRNGTPHKAVEGDNSAYNNVAARLAEQGFIVYAPYNPYRAEDRYRWLHRKANTIGKTLFSFIVAQHEQTLQWLATLPFVDRERIGFYGLSYGGETAMRVPAVLEGYSLSICSGDFGDWARKVTDTHYSGSFMYSLEWEMPYFRMGSTFSYAEMAYLIFPRPFMVERGHHDIVQPDEWVAHEYARVRFLYDQFNLEDRTNIQFFNGGHAMRLEETVKFLHEHLKWP